MPKSKHHKQPKDQNAGQNDLVALLENPEVFARVRDEILGAMSRRVENLRSISQCKASPLDACRITSEATMARLGKQKESRQAWYRLELCSDLTAPLILNKAESSQVLLYQQVRAKYLPNLFAKFEQSISAMKAALGPILKTGKKVEKDFKAAFGISGVNAFGGSDYAYYAVLAKSVLDRALGCADDVWDTEESGTVLTIASGTKMQTMQAARADKETCEKLLEDAERIFQQIGDASAWKTALKTAGQSLDDLAAELREIMDGRPRALSPVSNLEYAPGYTAVRWNGQNCTFSPRQASVCQVFHEEWVKSNKPILLNITEILARAEQKGLPSNIPSLGRLFNKHPFWGKVLQNAKPARMGLYIYDPQQR
jgi:hypothetical protein